MSSPLITPPLHHGSPPPLHHHCSTAPQSLLYRFTALPSLLYRHCSTALSVLVIDGGESMRCALVGGNLGQLAQNMGWAGIVVNGCIRDVNEINGCDTGVASHPQKSIKRGVGEKNVPVHIGGTLIHDGEWLYADSDGILVSKT
nr:putative 4-hydroxy-4-methyl-2-oxoglutarate aldolase 3 [Tanacetum cinerariifolium]